MQDSTTNLEIVNPVDPAVLQLQSDRLYQLTRCSYFQGLIDAMPCNLSIVFETPGRVRILDVKIHDTNAAEDQIIKKFATDMLQFHKTQLARVNEMLKDLRGE
ncbi:MAG TPA: hypothetical protein VK609_22990 [Mucilaginibacter sp.]|nr:hypothetical protein [Mucilaginibacter sp.]